MSDQTTVKKKNKQRKKLVFNLLMHLIHLMYLIHHHNHNSQEPCKCCYHGNRTEFCKIHSSLPDSDSHLEVVSSWRASTLKSQMNHFLYSSGHYCLKDMISHTHCHVISPQKWLKTTLLSHKHTSTATLDHIDIRKMTILQQNNPLRPSMQIHYKHEANMRTTYYNISFSFIYENI